jgi:hypothetical protein
MTLWDLLALLAALLVLTLALASRAEAFIYWADYGKNSIGRADLDGTGIDGRFISGIEIPATVAVDGRYIYWGGYGAGDANEFEADIVRARLDGTKVDWRFIPLPIGPYEGLDQIALDDDHIYWTEIFSHLGFADGSIGRANLDGTGVDESFIDVFTEGAVPTGIAVDANHIYWSQTGGIGPDSTQTPAIGRANLDGTGTERVFISSPSGTEPSAVEVDADHIYWINRQTTWPFQEDFAIARANLDGTGVDQSFIGGLHAGFPDAGFPADLAVDVGGIFWAAADTDGPIGAIGRADLDGANVDQRFITPAARTAPFGVAVNFSVGKLKKANDEGTARLTVDVAAPGGIALAQTKKVRGAEVRAEAAGDVRLPIKPRGRAKEQLADNGKAKVKVEVTYTPDGGQPDTQVAALKLIQRG